MRRKAAHAEHIVGPTVYIRGDTRAQLRERRGNKEGEWVGKVERWVDAVHIEEHSGDPRAMTTGLGERMTHAIRN